MPKAIYVLICSLLIRHTSECLIAYISEMSFLLPKQNFSLFQNSLTPGNLHVDNFLMQWECFLFENEFLCSLHSVKKKFVSLSIWLRGKRYAHSFLSIMDTQFNLILFFLNVSVQFLSHARNFNISEYSTQYVHLYLYIKHKPSYQKIIR